MSLDDAIEAISHIQSANGRMQQIGGGKLPLVVVDYAHTPDALEKVLITLKAQATSKLICVFGCGGNRDAGKRVLMGKVASEIADAVVVTSDNPRDEAPEKIIQDIVRICMAILRLKKTVLKPYLLVYFQPNRAISY